LNLDRTELYVADEAFLCGAGTMGPMTANIHDACFDVVYGRNSSLEDRGRGYEVGT